MSASRTTGTTGATEAQDAKRATPAGVWRGLLRRPSTLVALGLALALGVVWGVTIFRAAQPKTLDQREYEVASQLQCPICHGESVADSPSGLASEMRALIRQKLSQGESEQQVIQYFESRYGDSILEAPPAQGFTLLMWLPPALMLALGAYVVFVLGREWAAQPAMATAPPDADAETLDLSDEERQRLRETLLREMEDDEGMSFGSRGSFGAPDVRKGHA